LQITTTSAYFPPTHFTIDLTKASLLDSASLHFISLQALTRHVATAFDVCGHVTVIKDQNINDLHKSIKINAYSSTDAASAPLKSALLDAQLNFCMILDADTHYILKAQVTEPKLAKLLKLVPLERKVHVADKPVSNVNFGQLEARLDATIVLLPNPNQRKLTDLVVTIRSEDPSQDWSKDLSVQCNPDEVSSR